MSLCGVFASVLLWNILVPAESKFYLEMAFPLVDTTNLIEKMANSGAGENKSDQSEAEAKDRHFTLVVYECNGKRHNVICNLFEGQLIKHAMWETNNFIGVSDLELPQGHSLKMDGQWLKTKTIKALALGVKDIDLYLKKHMPPLADKKVAEKKVNRFLGRLIDLEDVSSIQTLVHYLSINHNGYFFHANTPSRQLFESYVAILQKVITASGYGNEIGALARPRSPQKPATETLKPQPQSTPKKPCGAGTLCRALFGSRFFSRSNSHPKKSWSQSWSSSKSKSKSSVQPVSDSGSQPKSFPKPPQSPPKPAPRPPTLSRSPSLSESYILHAAGFLAFKMFDPCFLLEESILESKDADYYCAVQCQFLSATMKVYGQIYAKHCQYLGIGFCKNKKCVCEPLPGVTSGDVNMVFCNNHLRLTIYE